MRPPTDKVELDAYFAARAEIARIVFESPIATRRDASRFAKELVDAVYLARSTLSVSDRVGNRYVNLHKNINRVIAHIEAIRENTPVARQFLGQHLYNLESALRAFAPEIVAPVRCKARFEAGKREYVLETMPRGPSTGSATRVADAAISVWFGYTGKPPAARKGSVFNRVLKIACQQASVKAPGRVVIGRQIEAFKGDGKPPTNSQVVRIWMKRASET